MNHDDLQSDLIALPRSSRARHMRHQQVRFRAADRNGIQWLSLAGVPITLAFVAILVYMFDVVSYKLNVADIAMVTAFIGVLLSRRFAMPGPVLWLAGFAVWAGLASLQGYSPGDSMDALWLLGKLAIVMWVVSNAIGTTGHTRWFGLALLSTFGVFVTGMALYFYMIGVRHVGRLVGYYTYANSNDIAALSLLPLGLSLGVFQTSTGNRLVRLASAAMALSCIAVVILSQSRGAMLGGLVTFGPFVALWVWRKKWNIVPISIAIALVIALGSGSSFQRFSKLANFSTEGDLRQVDEEGSAEQRLELAKTALAIARDRPLFGAGFGAWPLAVQDYAPQLGARDTHSTYLNVVAETGMPGLILFLGMIGSVLVYARKSIRLLKKSGRLEYAVLIQAMVVGLLAFFVASFFGTNVRLNFTYLFIAFVWAACHTAVNELSDSGTVRKRRRYTSSDISQRQQDTVEANI